MSFSKSIAHNPVKNGIPQQVSDELPPRPYGGPKGLKPPPPSVWPLLIYEISKLCYSNASGPLLRYCCIKRASKVSNHVLAVSHSDESPRAALPSVSQTLTEHTRRSSRTRDARRASKATDRVPAVGHSDRSPGTATGYSQRPREPRMGSSRNNRLRCLS